LGYEQGVFWRTATDLQENNLTSRRKQKEEQSLEQLET
jgi:hypothetical protein